MQNKTIVVGLTGQTGAGKTLVSQMLKDRGFTVIDADVVARQVVKKGEECLLELVLEFGAAILDESGSLNRRKLGSMVFADKEKRKRLNQITFPHIQRAIQTELAHMRDKGVPVVFLDAPTLFESGSDSYCDKVISVVADRDVRLERIVERDGISEDDAVNRINSQHDDDYYRSKSDFTIENSSTHTHLRVQMMEMLNVCCKGVPMPEDTNPI